MSLQYVTRSRCFFAAANRGCALGSPVSQVGVEEARRRGEWWDRLCSTCTSSVEAFCALLPPEAFGIPAAASAQATAPPPQPDDGAREAAKSQQQRGENVGTKTQSV